MKGSNGSDASLPDAEETLEHDLLISKEANADVDYDPFEYLREFYRLPDDATLLPVTEESFQHSLFNTTNKNILTYAKETESSSITKPSSLQVSRPVLMRVNLLGWIAHLIFLNGVADDPYVKALIFSLYIYVPQYGDPARLFVFFLKNFQVALTASRPEKYCRGALRYALSRVVRRRIGSVQLLNILYVALCRALGVHARIVLGLPSVQIRPSVNSNPSKHADELTSDSLSPPLKHNAKRRKSTQPPEVTIKSVKHLPHMAQLWAEVFWPTEKRWVAVDVGEKLFDLVSGDGHSNVFNRKNESHEQKNNYYFKRLLSKASPEEYQIDKRKNKALKEKKKKFSNLFLNDDSDFNLSTDSSDNTTDIALQSSTRLMKSLPENSRNDKKSITQQLSSLELKCPPSPQTEYDWLVERLGYTEMFYSFAKRKSGVQSGRKCRAIALESPSSIINESSGSSSPIRTSYVQRDQDHLAMLLENASSETMCLDKKSGIISKSSNIPKDEVFFETLRSLPFILACTSHSILRDVTRRYSSRWSEVVKSRGTLNSFLKSVFSDWNFNVTQNDAPAERFTIFDALDEYALQETAEAEQLPKSRNKLKNHLKFALESMIAGNEVIVPREPVLGFFNGEPVYPRRNVHRLYTHSHWEEKHGRCVNCREKPIKEHRGRELFAEWQTTIIKRKTLIDGKIPTNEYGNVNLIGKRTPPEGCVHLPHQPGLFSVLRRLQHVEWHPAIVRFDFSGGLPKPVVDGAVILERDLEYVRKLHNEYLSKKQDFQFSHCEERTIALWRVVFKSILSKQHGKVSIQTPSTLPTTTNEAAVLSNLTFEQAHQAFATHAATHEKEASSLSYWEELN